MEDGACACYGFASPETIKKNLDENPKLAELFPLGEKTMPDQEYIKDAVRKMLFEYDTDEKKKWRS